MILDVIKFTFIILSNFILFRKILNLSLTIKQKILCSFYSILLAIVAVLLNQLYIGLDLCAIIVLSPILFSLSYKQNLTTTIPTSILSIAMGYVVNFIALVLAIPLTLTLGVAMSYNYVFNLISYIFIGIISLILIFLVFKIKNFKQGFAFFYTGSNTEVPLILSLGIIFIYTFFRFGQIHSLHLFIIILVFIFVIALSLYISNERQIISYHNMQVKEREIEALKNELNIQQDNIQYVNNINSNLDKIIHKDNKLIPAMEFAVQELLLSYDHEKAMQLLKELNCISNERKGILTNYEHNSVAIANLKNARINSIVNYMHKNANEQNITFNFTYFGDISKLVNNISSEDDLCTLIADIVENALISCRYQTEKNVFLSIEAFSNNYSISVYDSGELFSMEILKKLGKKRVTTHKKDGGTGIGLMTTFEILKKYNASFSIDETINNPQYTKCVSITFDSKHTHTYNGGPLYT